MIVGMEKPKRSQEYSNEFLRGQVDSCQIQKEIISNYFVKAIAESLKEYSNYRFPCPHKKGFYYAFNFPVYDVRKFFPLVAVRNANTTVAFEFTVTFSELVRNQPRTIKERVLLGKIYGKIVY
jgi:Protein of unknown function (DUF1091)